MAVEIEKKYRLTEQQRESVLQRLAEIGAQLHGKEFEENTLYAGGSLDVSKNVLRLRRIGDKATLTYKERFSRGAIKHQREDETRVDDPDAMNAILEALGFGPALLYEKWRETWSLGDAEIVIDELPFGLFMEIEGSEKEIRKIERKIGLKGLKAEHLTYPQLTQKHGQRDGNLIASRFTTVKRKANS